VPRNMITIGEVPEEVCAIMNGKSCSCSVACDGARARNRRTQFLTPQSITSTASLSTSTSTIFRHRSRIAHAYLDAGDSLFIITDS
jgi:hypothetical protein